MNAFLPRKSRAFARTALSRALLLALAGAALPAHADDECGPATDGQVVCEAGETPLSQVHYVGVDDLEVRLEPGVVVDGSALPEGDTAVVLYGAGDLSLQGDTGTTILAHGAWPAVDVVSSDGSVDIRLDTVHGGSVGIAALAAQDVSVWANTVTGATGIEAVSLGGDVVVDVADVEASQFGVFAHAVDGDVNVLAGRTIVTGDYSTGLVAFSEHGSVGIDAGFVRAEGVFAWAIQAQAWEGDVLVDVDTAVAMGEAASAIVASSGLGDVRVRTGWASASGGGGVAIGVFANEGDVYIDADAVYTEGDTSRGIDAGAFGDVHVRAGSATTDGIGSDAIVVETTGTVTVASDWLTTYGDDSYGLRVLTGGDVALDIDQVDTFGERASALQAMTNTGDIAARVGRVHTRATTGDWYAIGLSSFEGDVALQVDELVRADSGHAITLGAWYGGAHVVVGEGATVYGQTTAIDAATGAGTRIDILGTVESVDGPALTIAGTEAGLGAADIRIGDTGILRGRVALSGGDDVLASEGRVYTAGTNDFGAGTDRFLNGGDVRLLGDADAMSFAGLERFDNLGLVSLANGRTGDRFALDGTLHGDGSGRLAIDLDVETGAVDRFEVGALTGTQQLQIDLVGRGPLLGLDGVQVFTSAGPQTGDELVLAADSRYRGFVGYRLDYDGIDSWTLDSDLADEAYLAAAVPGGVRDFWRQGTQSVATHLAATRGQADGGGAWLQAVGGDFDGTSSFEHALGSREL